MSGSSAMRIGELSQRVGMTTHALRAWEKRYGLLRPTRTPGGYRVYGPADEKRVRHMLALRAQGVPAAEGAMRVLAEERRADLGDAVAAVAAVPATFQPLFSRAVEHFDEAVAQAALDDLIASAGVEGAIEGGILPYLQDLGERWERGHASVAQEHFASHLIWRRLSVWALTWGVGTGPVAVLACPPGERHDLALLAFGVVLGRQGWRIRYLGQDTPVADMAAAAAAGADVIVVAATSPGPLLRVAPELRELAATHVVRLAGRGATVQTATELGISALGRDVVAATLELPQALPARSAASPG